MDILPLLCAVAVTFTGLTKGAGVLPDGPLNAAVGETVMFTPTLTPSETPFLIVTWEFDGKDIIVFHVDNTTTPEYEGRITLFISTGSLELRNLTRDDSGEYSVSIYKAGVGGHLRGNTRLAVHVRVSDVMATASSTDLLEDSSVRLSCSSSGSSLSFLWFNGSSEVTASDRVQLTDGGANVTINVTRYDQGPFRCHVSNSVSNGTSGPINLSINLRVSDVMATASSTDLLEDSSVRLSCSSSGSSLSFLWFNGSSEVTASDRVQLTDGGANVTINVTRYDQQPFRCHVSNPVSFDRSDLINLTISYGPENINLTISPSQEYYEEGLNISLMCSADSRPVAQYTWLLNGVLLSDTGPELSLMNIQESKSGNYSCQANNSKTLSFIESPPAAISVLTRVANVMVTSNTTDMLEYSAVRLSCSSSGSFLSFLWLNGSSEITESDRVQLSDGGSTLTIVSVTRYDQGPFRCQVSNPVSNGTSGPVNLSINYGPENINLTISLSQEYYDKGSNISLMCSAVSRPYALFQWFLNGDLLSDAGPKLRLMNIQMSQSGNYSCQAFNNRTLKKEMSQPSVVSVLERISGASITSKTNSSIEGNSFNLSCDAAGSVFTREWMKNGLHLTPDDNMALYDDNRVLSFNNLSKKDTGYYLCKVSNPLSHSEAAYNMVVFYGPENVQINGPNEIRLTETLTLNCFAESVPATYTWMLNGTKIHNSSVFTKDNTEYSDSGEYICEVMNNITGRTSSAVHGLSVTAPAPPPPPPPPFPAGGIVGIVIAGLVICGAVGGGYYIYVKKNRTSKLSTTTNRNPTTGTGAEGQDNKSYAGGQELNYADISVFQNKDGGTVQLGLQSNSSEYAQIRVNNNPPAASSPPTYEAHEQRIKKPAPQPRSNATEVYAQVRKK